MNRILRSYPLPAFVCIVAIVFGLERLMQLSETPNAQRTWLIHIAWLAFISGLCRWAILARKKDEDTGFSPRFLFLGPAFFFSGVILLVLQLVVPHIQQLEGFPVNIFRNYDDWLLITLMELTGLAMLFCGPFFRIVSEKHRPWVPLLFFPLMAGAYFWGERMIDFIHYGIDGQSFFDFMRYHFYLNELPLVVLLVLIVCTAQLLFRFTGWPWFTFGAFAGHYLVINPRFDLQPTSSGMFTMDIRWTNSMAFMDDRPAFIGMALLLGVWIVLLVFLIRSERRKREISVGREDLVD